MSKGIEVKKALLTSIDAIAKLEPFQRRQVVACVEAWYNLKNVTIPIEAQDE